MRRHQDVGKVLEIGPSVEFRVLQLHLDQSLHTPLQGFACWKEQSDSVDDLLVEELNLAEVPIDLDSSWYWNWFERYYLIPLHFDSRDGWIELEWVVEVDPSCRDLEYPRDSCG
jgi:hypothetical protein